MTINIHAFQLFFFQKQETESFTPLVYAINEMDWWAWQTHMGQDVTKCTFRLC